MPYKTTRLRKDDNTSDLHDLYTPQFYTSLRKKHSMPHDEIQFCLYILMWRNVVAFIDYVLREKCNSGAVYTTARAGPALGSARNRHMLVHLHLIPGPDLNQKFHAIIAADASHVCYTFILKLCVLDRRSCTMTPSRSQPFSGVELGAGRFRSGTAKTTVNAPFHTQSELSTEMFAIVHGPTVSTKEEMFCCQYTQQEIVSIYTTY